MEDADFYTEEPEDAVEAEQPPEESGDESGNESGNEQTEEPTDVPATEAEFTEPTSEPLTEPTEFTERPASPTSPTSPNSAASSQSGPSTSSMPIGSGCSSLRCSQNSNAPSQHAGRLFGARAADSITDAIRYPLRLERYFHEHDLMVPKDKDLDSIEANEKSWTMVRPCSPSVTDGISWSFVDMCSGLSSELLKVCHFFDMMNGMSNHHPWNGFAVSTTDISNNGQGRNLLLKYNGKEVIGAVDSKHVETAYNPSLGSSGGRGVDTAKLLQASEMTSAGTQNTSLPLFKIQLSFTAAFFRADQPNSEDEEGGEARQTTFGIVTITSLRNVDALKLIVVGLLLCIYLSFCNPLPETNLFFL